MKKMTKSAMIETIINKEEELHNKYNDYVRRFGKDDELTLMAQYSWVSMYELRLDLGLVE